MTKEALRMALDALKSSNKLINGTGTKFGLEGAMDGYYSGCFDVEGNNKLLNKAITAIKEALAQPEQEPVAMKFKIYKPTAPDPVRQGINNALLPWVYDQDRSSGFDASMWVTPVATLPPQRKPLTREVIERDFHGRIDFVRQVEAAHNITAAKLKEKNHG